MSADPIGQAGGINVYNYALNSPTNLIDPTGEFVCGGLCVAAIGGFFAAGVPLLAAAVSDALSDDPCANATGEVGKALGVAAGSVVAAAGVVGTAAALAAPVAVVAATGATPFQIGAAGVAAEGVAFAAADASGPGTAVSSGKDLVDFGIGLAISAADRLLGE